MADEQTPASTTDIIMDSIKGLEGVDTPDVETDVDTETETEVEKPAEKEKESTPEEKAKADEEALHRELDELDKPVKGKKVNAIPQPRVKQMTAAAVARAKKEWQAEVDRLRKEEDAKFAPKKAKYEQLDKLDNLVNNPDEFLAFLQTVNPVYKDKLTPKQGPQKAARPEPDGVDANGNPAWTKEGWDKYMAWERTQAVEEARNALKTEMEAEYGPLKKKYQTEKFVEAQKPRLDAQVARAKGRYGDKLFDDNSPAISQQLAKNADDPYYTFEDACADVLVPLMRSDEAKIRQKLLDEMNERAEVAEKSDSQPKVPESNPGNKTSRDIIAEIARSLK